MTPSNGCRSSSSSTAGVMTRVMTGGLVATFCVGLSGLGGGGGAEEEEDEEEDVPVGYGSAIAPSMGSSCSSSEGLAGGRGQDMGVLAGLLGFCSTGASICRLGTALLLMALSSSISVGCGPKKVERSMVPSWGARSSSSSSGIS